eukprot:6019441-Prymnesium_polylepis.2
MPRPFKAVVGVCARDSACVRPRPLFRRGSTLNWSSRTASTRTLGSRPRCAVAENDQNDATPPLLPSTIPSRASSLHCPPLAPPSLAQEVIVVWSPYDSNKW